MSAPIRLPAEHPLRRRLANEVHARPPVSVAVPGVASAIALLHGADGDDLAPLAELARAHGVAFDRPEHPHLILELPGLRVKWERHSEFTSYVFVRGLPGARLEDFESLPTAFAALPPDWLATLPGQTIAAIDVTLIPAGEVSTEEVARRFAGPAPCAAEDQPEAPPGWPRPAAGPRARPGPDRPAAPVRPGAPRFQPGHRRRVSRLQR